MDVAPVVGSGSAMELEYFENLIDFGVAIEHRLLFDQLCENTTDCPNINTETVLLLAKEHLRGSVPQSLNLMSESLNRNAEGSSESEISNFEIASPIHQQILGFEIPVNNPSRVAVVDTIDKLVQE